MQLLRKGMAFLRWFFRCKEVRQNNNNGLMVAVVGHIRHDNQYFLLHLFFFAPTYFTVTDHHAGRPYSHHNKAGLVWQEPFSTNKTNREGYGLVRVGARVIYHDDRNKIESVTGITFKSRIK